MTADRKFVPTKLTPETLCALLAIRGELPVKIYLVLADLGAHLSSGWQGSIQTLTERLNESSGRHFGQSAVGAGVARLISAGLLAVEGHANYPRRWRLRGSPETSDPEKAGSPETSELDHRKPVSRSPETSDPLYDSGERGEKERDNNPHTRPLPTPCAPARDVCINKIVVRNGAIDALAAWPADGLGDEVRAAGLRLSDTRVENLVRRCDSAEVRRQLGWWPRRVALWGEWKPRSPERVFEAHCENRDLEPDEGQAGASVKVLSPDAMEAFVSELDYHRRYVGDDGIAVALAACGVVDMSRVTTEQRRQVIARLEAVS